MTFSGFALIAAACLVTYLVVAKVLSFIEGYRFAKANGCKPPTKYPQPERIIGYKHYKLQVALSKSKMILPTGLSRFREIGNTYSVVTMGQKIIVTTEPENVKEMLATKFKDFGIGKRLDALGALLGQGIFTSDGLLWEHSRVRRSILLRTISCSLFLGTCPP